MIALAAIGEPPLLACAVEIENRINHLSQTDEDHLKRISGRMVREILRQYKYHPKKINNSNKNVKKRFPKRISSGAVFVRKNKAT